MIIENVLITDKVKEEDEKNKENCGNFISSIKFIISIATKVTQSIASSMH
jgi:hypothetical protein